MLLQQPRQVSGDKVRIRHSSSSWVTLLNVRVLNLTTWAQTVTQRCDLEFDDLASCCQKRQHSLPFLLSPPSLTAILSLFYMEISHTPVMLSGLFLEYIYIYKWVFSLRLFFLNEHLHHLCEAASCVWVGFMLMNRTWRLNNIAKSKEGPTGLI